MPRKVILERGFCYFMEQTDRYYMQMVLELARRGCGRTSPNPMVGAVVVKDGEVVGEGYHLKAGTPHAEVIALREAGEKAKGATLYVNLEPCCHYGRTGPCTETVLAAGVKRVVIAMTDPNPLMSGKGIYFLKQHGLEIVTGVLEKEARLLNEVFVKYITTGRPFVVLKAAMSLDGKIATCTGESQWITGPQARWSGHRLRHWYDAILVGINTVLSDDPSLTARLPEEKGKDPVRVIVDSMARTPVNARVITQLPDSYTIIAATEKAPLERVAALKKAGARVLVVPGSGPRVDLAALMGELARLEITSVLIEGGGEVNASALASGIVDKVVWFIAPKIIGGREAPCPVGGRGISRLAEAGLIENLTVRRCGEDVCLEGYLVQKMES